jgi:hypothetical protein
MKFILTLLISFVSYSGRTQNLISNSSFEDSLLYTWSSPLSKCYNILPNICSRTDLGANLINFDAQNGKKCLYLSLFQCYTTWSDFITHPIPKLIKGKKYQISFYITPDDSTGYFSKEIHFLACDSTYFYQNLSCVTSGKILLTPTLIFDISRFKKTGQQGNWSLISGEFVADGSENFISIGRFTKKGSKNISTRIFHYKPSKQQLKEQFCAADYYLDNFSLILND